MTKLEKYIEENRVHCWYYPSTDCEGFEKELYYCDTCKDIVCANHIAWIYEPCERCLKDHKEGCSKENHEECFYLVCGSNHNIIGKRCESCRDNCW